MSAGEKKLRKIADWGIHCCALDRDCREHGAPSRLHLRTPWGHLILALGRDSWTQGWLPRRGYQDWFSPLVWHPTYRRR